MWVGIIYFVNWYNKIIDQEKLNDCIITVQFAFHIMNCKIDFGESSII